MSWRRQAAIEKLRSDEVKTKELYIGGDPLAGTDPTQVTASAAELNLNAPAVGGATFTIGDEAGNSINVAIQLTDADGNDLAAVSYVTAFLSDADTGIGVAATAPDGDIAIGTDGAILGELVADKVFLLQSEADGDIDLDIGESGADTFYLVVILPNGTQVVSGEITFAS